MIDEYDTRNTRGGKMPIPTTCGDHAGSSPAADDGCTNAAAVKIAVEDEFLELPALRGLESLDDVVVIDSDANSSGLVEYQVLQSIDTNSMEDALVKAVSTSNSKPPVETGSSGIAANGSSPLEAEKENSAVKTEADPGSPVAPGMRGDETADRKVDEDVVAESGAPTNGVVAHPERPDPVPVTDQNLEVCKECVRAYVEVEEPLEALPECYNPHVLNLERIVLPTLGLHLRPDEEPSPTTEPVKFDNDWILEENVAPLRAPTAKRIWRQVDDESGERHFAPVVIGPDSECALALKRRCVSSGSLDQQLLITDDDYVWERSRPGFSGEDFLKVATNSTVGCANTVKKKYFEQIYRRRRPRTLAGKVNGLTKLAGGRSAKKPPQKNLARELPADGFQFSGRRNKVLAVAAEILGEVATTASDEDVKAEDEEMPLSTGSEAMVDGDIPERRAKKEQDPDRKDDDDEDTEEAAGALAARESGGAAISSSSPAVARVGSATSSVQGVSISSLGSKTYTGSQGSVRQLSLVELARLQGVVQKGALGRPRGLRPSLFSNVPPTINFALHNTHAEEIPPFLKKHMRWKLSNLTPLVVRKVLGHSNLRLMKSDSTEWIGHWGKHMKAVMFKDFKAYQKINHFPGTFVIGRKDRLWRGFAQFRSKFGKNEFNFLPRTFILPNDLRELKESMDRKGGRGQNYIVKPPASARGTGVYVVNNYSAINAERQLVVQKYITRPFLINGTKFDLRLYIFVASYNPLRLYLYRDGLVRFASEKYNSSSRTLNHQFVHLTNYSINRKSGNYQANNSVNECQGHKWTLLAFWKFLRRLGVNTGLLWASIQDIVIKTILTSEATVNDMMERHVRSRYSTFELFGFDIILDETLKPWLLEVNISPSLHSSSALDEDVKGRMLRDLFNLMMLHIPAGKLSREEERETVRQCRLPPDTLVAHDPVLYTDELSRTERNKHDYYQTKNRRKDYLRTILSELTPDDIRQLIVAEDELARCGDYVRIFPTQYTYLYHRFFEKPRYYNLLLDAWEFHYHSDRLAGRLLLEHYCSKKYHLQFRKDVSYRRIHVQRLLSVPTNPQMAASTAMSTSQQDYKGYGAMARRDSASTSTSARVEPSRPVNIQAPQKEAPSPPSNVDDNVSSNPTGHPTDDDASSPTTTTSDAV